MRTAPVEETWEAPPARAGILALVGRGAWLIAASTSVWLLWLVLAAATAFAPAARRRARGWAYRLWARGLLRALGVTVEVRGAPPERACVLVSNHLSYVDVPVLASLWDCTFVAKAEIDGWPYAGTLSRSMGTIFVDRDRHREIPRVNAAIRAALDRGIGVVIFAEGRSTRGRSVEPFRSALLEPAADLGRPVAWVCLHYDGPAGAAPAARALCYWGDAGFVEHLVSLLRQPRGWRAVVTFGDEPVPAGDRKELARELHARVAGAFVPVPGAEPCAR